MAKTNFVRTLLIQRCFESLGCLPPKIQQSTTRRRSITISVHNEQNGVSLSKDSYECVDHILKPALNLIWRAKRVISLGNKYLNSSHWIINFISSMWSWCCNDQSDWSKALIKPHDWKLSSNQVYIAKIHPQKLSPITCDYEQLILIRYNYN